MGAVPGVLWRARRLALRLGPSAVDGPVCGRGTLVVTAKEAPTVGRSIEFPYEVKLTCTNGAVRCRFQHKGYKGAVFLDRDGEKVTGRLEFREAKAFAGSLDTSSGRVILGYAPGSGLSFLNGRIEFVLKDGTVTFADTDNSQGCLHLDSYLEIAGEHITGQIDHARRSWTAAADLHCDALPVETGLLCLLLTANAVLDFHHE